MFPCTRCGECCRRVNQADETKWLDRGDGICRHFDVLSKLCYIYHERPQICRVDEMFYALFYHRMNKDEFYRLNADSCNLMQEQAGLNVKYRL